MSLVDRLREKKMVQWGLGYVAGAWVVVQVLDVLGEQWGWSLALQRGVSVALAVGLSVALVLAWHHGERGHQRVTASEATLVAALSLLAVGAGWWAARADIDTVDADGRVAEVDTQTDERPAIAALPFVNRSASPDDAYFVDGVRDEILTRLIKLSGIRVISRTSVMAYRDSPKPLPEIAEELDSRYILEGGLLRAGENVRIDVKLFDGRADDQLWAESFDRPLTIENLLEIQTDVAQQVAAALDATIAPEEQAALTTPTTSDLTALDLYFLARSHWRNRDEASLQQAIGLFRQAIQIDPLFARAYAGLADAMAVQTFHYNPGNAAVWNEVLATASRAIELDGDLAEAHASLGFALTYGPWDWAAAGSAFETAIALDPENATAHYWYCELLIATLDSRAEQACREAVRVDPRSAVAHNVLSQVFLNTGQYAQARDAAGEARRFSPDWPAANNNYALSNAALGNRQEFDAAIGKSVFPPEAMELLWRIYSEGQDPAAAEELAAISPSPSYSAVVLAMNGLEDRALEELLSAADQREEILLLMYPMARNAVADPEVFAEVERRLGIGGR